MRKKIQGIGWCMVWVGVWWLWTGVAVGQSRRGAPEYEIRPVELIDWGGNVFVEGQYQKDKQTRNGTETDSSDMFFQEGVELHGNGYFYHPNLIDWNAAMRLGLSQQMVTTDGVDKSTDGTILGYNLSGLMFKQKNVSFRVFAYQSQQQMNRDFAAPIDSDTNGQGVEMQLKDWVTGVFGYEHLGSVETSESRDEEKDSHLFYGELVRAEGPEREVRLRYEHEEVDQTTTFIDGVGGETTEDLPDTRDEMNLAHRWPLGEGDDSVVWSGSVRGLMREGFFPEQFFSIDERVDVDHGDDLASYYRGSYLWDETDTSSQKTAQGEAGVTKKVYRNLNVGGRVLVTDEQLDEGTQRTWEGYVDLDYFKKTPVGRYSSTLNVGLLYREQAFPNGVVRVDREAVTLTGIVPVALSRTGVLAGSVVVRDAGNVAYPSSDYVVTTVGVTTEIARTAGSSIPSGGVVFVSYSAAAGTDTQTLTDMLDWRQRLDLKDLPVPVGLYTQVRWRDESLVDGDDPGNLENDQMILGGLDVTLGTVVVSGEYEVRDLRLSPSYDAYRFDLRMVQELWGDTNFTASGGYEMLEYRESELYKLGDGEDFQETYRANVGVNTKVGRNVLVRLNAGYYRVMGRREDSLAQMGGGVTWSEGQLEVSVDGHVGYFEQTLDDKSDSGMTAFLGMHVKRWF